MWLCRPASTRRCLSQQSAQKWIQRPGKFKGATNPDPGPCLRAVMARTEQSFFCHATLRCGHQDACAEHAGVSAVRSRFLIGKTAIDVYGIKFMAWKCTSPATCWKKGCWHLAGMELLALVESRKYCRSCHEMVGPTSQHHRTLSTHGFDHVSCL